MTHFIRKTKSQKPRSFYYQAPAIETKQILDQFKKRGVVADQIEPKKIMEQVKKRRDEEKNAKLSRILNLNKESMDMLMNRGNNFTKMYRVFKSAEILQAPKVTYLNNTNNNSKFRKRNASEANDRQQPKEMKKNQIKLIPVSKPLSTLPQINSCYDPKSLAKTVSSYFPAPFQPKEDMKKIKEARKQLRRTASQPNTYFSTEILAGGQSSPTDTNTSVSRELNETTTTPKQDKSFKLMTEIQYSPRQRTDRSHTPARMRSSFTTNKRSIAADEIPGEGIVPINNFKSFRAEKRKIEIRRAERIPKLEPIGLRKITERSQRSVPSLQSIAGSRRDITDRATRNEIQIAKTQTAFRLSTHRSQSTNSLSDFLGLEGTKSFAKSVTKSMRRSRIDTEGTELNERFRIEEQMKKFEQEEVFGNKKIMQKFFDDEDFSPFERHKLHNMMAFQHMRERPSPLIMPEVLVAHSLNKKKSKWGIVRARLLYALRKLQVLNLSPQIVNDACFFLLNFIS